MKNFFQLMILVFIGGFFSACASGPGFMEVNPSLSSDQADKGRIFFYRNSGMGAAIQPDVMLNGEKVGSAQPMGFFYVDRPAGEYKVSTSTEVERTVSFTLEKGQTRFIRLSISMGFFAGHVYGELVEESVGLSEIRECNSTEEKT